MRAVIFAAAVIAVAFAADFELDEGVIVGTDANLDSVIETHEYALVEFYAPWCGHCKQLTPEYIKAAAMLKEQDSPVVLVKVDATVHDKSGEKYQVQGYPTLKWFKNGQESEYQGGRTASEIVSWINKKSGPPATDAATVAAVEKIAKTGDVTVLGVFSAKEDIEADTFIAVASAMDFNFVISTSEEVATHYKTKAPGMVVIKEFDGGNVVYDGKFEGEDLTTFINAESMPLVMEFTDESASKIFGGDIKSHLLLFTDTSDEDFGSLKSVLETTAQEFKGQVLFIYIDGNKGDNSRILDYFGIDAQQDLPAIRVINLEEDMAKYKYEEETIDADSVKAFVQSYVDGNLQRHLNAEDVPDDWDAKPVKILTGKNFHDVAMDEAKNVLVFLHAPWCGHCKSLSPTWDKLAEKFEDNEDVVIAKMDATANELEEIAVESFPTLKFFPAGSDEILDYEGGRDLAALVEYLNEKVGASVEVTEEDKAAVAQEGDEEEEEGDYEEYEDDEPQEDEQEGDEAAGHDEL
eukprot:m.140746 g.140746  ORF g.140746 m.140746 type:complete len:521 (-) comp16114_c1_seq1:66-1628(-)